MVLINSQDDNTSKNFNYIVSIKGIKFKNSKLILQRVSVTDKKFENIFLNFIDIVHDINNPASFVRIINNNKNIYDNGIRKLSVKKKKVKYFTNLPKCKCLTNNFITMDLETKEIEGNLTPYCVSIFDGKKSYSFYITDYENS